MVTGGKQRWGWFVGGLFVLAIVAVWWRAPSPSWACEWRDDACLGRTQLRPVDLGFRPAPLDADAVAVSPDGTTLVVAFRPLSSPDVEAPGALALFDVETGAQQELLLSADDGLYPSGPAFAVDGSTIAVSVLRPTADATAETFGWGWGGEAIDWAGFMVFDLESGERQAVARLDWSELAPDAVDERAVALRRCDEAGSIRLTESGDALVCGGEAFEVPDPLYTAFDPEASALLVANNRFIGPVVSGLPRVALTPAAESDPDGGLTLDDFGAVRYNGDEVVFQNSELGEFERIEITDRQGWSLDVLALNSNENLIFATRSAPGGFWRSVLPRALSPEADIELYSRDGGVVARYELGAQQVAGAWRPDSTWLVVVDENLVVTRLPGESG